jgi:hypothetical protein
MKYRPYKDMAEKDFDPKTIDNFWKGQYGLPSVRRIPVDIKSKIGVLTVGDR